ncbi:glycoside hydrolase family 43 protein [Maribellus maritimus]|uniref:glycoside hydrolase family 43 protein n=1 Tax=Maribellus maritimus TaxID=2870838 RepID=UPI001EEB4CAA|nr:glycoside hydrolase family 43 protein [Maribellus maritimus]MCG6190097.1 family 43 glycosylhydrolase [Maribellus maritimus]
MKRTILLLATLMLLNFCTKPAKEKKKAFYTNPVIAGDFPDPTIIRVGDTYYAAGTSNDFAPNYPVYESKDLINWKRTGAVFNQPPEWASEDFWAPELFWHNETFYMYYTTKRKDNGVACIGVATTKNIHKGFTDHGIIIEWGEEAIDAFVFRDDDGKLYITWKAYGLTQGRDIEILGSELSDDGLGLKGSHFTLTDHNKGWQGAGDEGQCLVKHNNYYYLFYSVGGCCDNRCDYRVRVARSKNLKSGWEQYPEPILKGGEEWRCPGHGTLVNTPDNRYFYLYHSYNAVDFEYIGRQGMLGEVLWDAQTGWPYFKSSTPTVTAEVPFTNTVQKKDTIFNDDFSSDKYLPFWEWEVNHPKPGIQVVDGEMIVSPAEDGVNFLGLRPETGDYRMTAETIQTNGLGGIGVYSNRDYLIALTTNKSELVLFKIQKGKKEILAAEPINEMGAVYLRYEATNGKYFEFFWSENGEEWLPVNVGNEYQLDGTFIAQWGYSPRAGFIVEGDVNNDFRFNNLKIEYYY